MRRSREKKRLPNLIFERKLWRREYKLVAGVDEVGRGSFAGPVVAAAVVFPPNILTTGVRIDDSKKLTRIQRELAERWIRKNAITWGVGEASAALINRLGMGKATKVAFRKAVKAANSKIDFLLIDAFFVPNLSGFPIHHKNSKTRKNHKKGSHNPKLKNPKARQLAIVNGDERSFSIAAASIVAKVYRDNLMLSLSKKSKYKIYGWESNKGYATKHHRDAILKYGITGYHRKQFVDTFLNNQ